MSELFACIIRFYNRCTKAKALLVILHMCSRLLYLLADRSVAIPLRKTEENMKKLYQS